MIALMIGVNVRKQFSIEECPRYDSFFFLSARMRILSFHEIYVDVGVGSTLREVLRKTE